jgi:DNA adenine methylase
VIPYQGSKRRLAPQILATLEGRRYRRMIEPFCGSAAMTLAAARADVADRYVLGDLCAPIAELWSSILATPDAVADAYEALWVAQHADPKAHYLEVRAAYWREPTPAALLYLLARAVKNAARWGADGRFNQSADHRRRGVRPERMRAQIAAAAALLRGRTEAQVGDFEALLADAGERDLVYLDPPYVGTSTGSDRRYVASLERERLIEVVAAVRARGAALLLSYDGRTGERDYGPPMPSSLGLRHLLLDAGRSSQATLLGRDERTLESLYVAL